MNTSHAIKKIDKRLNINDFKPPSHLFHVRFAILACGVTKPGRIVDIVGAFDVKLTEDDIAYLDELYVPHKLVGVMARFGR